MWDSNPDSMIQSHVSMQTSPHVTAVSHEMPKFARYCVRLLKQEKTEMLWESCCFSGRTGVRDW